MRWPGASGERARRRSGRVVRPSDLLWPDRQLVPFRGRARELEQLRTWCREPAAPRFFLVTGPALVGKTRLMVELASRGVGPGWRVSRLRPGHEKDAFAALAAVEGSHLVMVEVCCGGVRPGGVSGGRGLCARGFPVACGAGVPQPRRHPETSRTRRRAESWRARRGSPLAASGAHGGAEDLRRWRSEAAAAFSREIGTEARRSVGPVDAPGDPIGLVVARGLADALGDSHQGEPVFAALARRELRTWPALVVRRWRPRGAWGIAGPQVFRDGVAARVEHSRSGP